MYENSWETILEFSTGYCQLLEFKVLGGLFWDALKWSKLHWVLSTLVDPFDLNDLLESFELFLSNCFLLWILSCKLQDLEYDASALKVQTDVS